MLYDPEKITKAIQAFKNGEIVIVTDDDGRENEGDLVIAASHCTREKMAFIIRHSSGIICTPMPLQEARRLNLSPMVDKNDSAYSTAFTVSVDYKYGTSTGISAHDRNLTVRNLADPQSCATDFLRPGHIFPLIAREGGVLMRSGHTEAAVDLCRLAQLPPVGVIGELVNDDGSVKNGEEIAAFARENKLLTLTVADLITYRQRTEKLIEYIGDMPVETEVGPARAYSYQLPWEPMHHIAIVFGDIEKGENIPVRLHRENVLRDVFEDKFSFTSIVQRMLNQEKCGVFVYLREGSIGVSKAGEETIEANLEPEAYMQSIKETHDQALKREEEWREIGLGAQILKHLGINSVHLFASKERHYIGLEGFGIKIHKTDIL